MHRFKRLTCSILLALTGTAPFVALPLATSVAEASTWQFLYEADGIKVSQEEGSDLPSYQAEGYIEGGLFDVMAVIADLSRRVEWMKDLASTRVVEGDFESTAVLYERYKFPWPARDRDTVTKSTVTVDYQKMEVNVHYFNVEHPTLPPISGLIRIPRVDGRILFRYVNDEKTYTKQQITLDVGGGLPKWAVRWLSRKMPVDTLLGLQRQVRATRGKYPEFIKRHLGQVPR